MIDPKICEAVERQLALPHKAVDAELDAKTTLLKRTAALWKLRWRHANTMVSLFEGKHDSYYYTACGEGPSSKRYVEEIVPGKFIEYKHLPYEWVKIWENVAEKLLNKVREANIAAKSMDPGSSLQPSAKTRYKRNCLHCIYCSELQEKDADTYRTFCTCCSHWVNWAKKLSCTQFVLKDRP